MSVSMAASVRRFAVMGAAAMLAVGLLAGPAGAQDIPMGGDLVAGIEGDIVAFDPAFAYDFTANPVVASVTEGLLKFKDGAVVPNLAESFTSSEDGLTWTYVLRDGVLFSDGTPMTIDDVIYSWERIRNPETASYVGWMFGSVDTITAVDDKTLEVKLKNNDAFWQYVPATTAGHVISKAHAEAHPEDLGTSDVGVIGTGPFAFQSWSTGDQIVLVRNDNYWNKANGGPYLDTVTFKILTDATTRTAGLQTGELSAVLASIPGDQLPIVAGMDNVELQLTDTYLTDFIAFNTQRPPFDNAKLRQALNYAIDKVGVRTISMGDFALDAKATQVGPAMWVFEKEAWEAAYAALPDYAQDMEKAAALLAESGVADQLDGKVITVDENPVRVAQALALQDAAAQLGHQLEIERITFTELISRSFSGARDYDIIITNWGSDFPDPAGNLLPNYTTGNTGDGGANFANYSNPKIDELLDGQHAEVDNAKRTEMMLEAQAIIAEDSPLIWFDHPRHPFALNKQFTGYTIPALWYWDSFVKDIHLAQ